MTLTTPTNCRYCGAPLDPSRRAGIQYCSDSHRALAGKRRKRDERDKAKAAALGVSLKRYRAVMSGGDQ